MTANVYLSAYLAPLAPWLSRPDVTDVLINRPGEVWVGFGPDCVGAALTLSGTGDLVEAAASLFHCLREADRLAGPGGAIAVAPIPQAGLGRAINDRLGRAAAPRA